MIFRSLIFVPGNNSRFLDKAKSLSADIVCFDLEDSVPANQKTQARNLIKTALKERKQYSSFVYVRTNAPSSDKILDDLKQVVVKGIDGIVIPKVNNAQEVIKIAKVLDRLEKKQKLRSIKIIPSIESAQGVVNCYEICISSKRISAIVFGVFDLLNDLGIEYTKQSDGAKYSRAKIPIDAHAANVPAIDAIWQEIKDIKGLQDDCKIAKGLGYAGKSIVHPDQIKTTHKIFRPTVSEIKWAKKVCDVYPKSVKKGKGAITLDGKMIDEVHYKQAKLVLSITDN